MNFRFLTLALCFCFAFVAPFNSGPAVAKSKVKSIYKTALSGRSVFMRQYVSVNPDCSVDEVPEVIIRSQPKHGELEIGMESDFPHFAAKSSLEKCNQKAVHLRKVRYKSKEGYKGRDRFTIEVFWVESGYSIRQRFVVTVK